MKAPFILTFLLALVLALLGVLGCGEGKDDHAGHDHAESESAESAGHDHHDHEAGHPDGHGKHVEPGGDGAKHHHDHAADEHEGHTDEVKLTPEAVLRWGIRVEPAATRRLVVALVAPAQLAFDAEAMAHVGSAVPGRVVDLKARVGDVVKKGDVLLEIESSELGLAQSEYVQRRTGLTVANSAVEPAKLAYERAKKLYDQSQGVSLAELQRREAELRAAEGAVLAAKAAEVAALNRLHLLGTTPEDVKRLEDDGTLRPRLSVRAPIDGRVIEREVTPGELVSPEKESLLVIADTGKVWAIVQVPEVRLDAVAVGAAARVRVAASREPIAGKVSHVSPSLDAGTRTARVRIDLPNPDGKLRPGTFATVEIETALPGDDAAKVLALPEAAVQTVEGGPAVFVPVEGEANTFAKRAVTVGDAVGGWVPVTGGLAEGERVVTWGAFILKADLGKSGAAHEH